MKLSLGALQYYWPRNSVFAFYEAMADTAVDEASADVTVVGKDGSTHHVFVERAIGLLGKVPALQQAVGHVAQHLALRPGIGAAAQQAAAKVVPRVMAESEVMVGAEVMVAACPKPRDQFVIRRDSVIRRSPRASSKMEKPFCLRA